MYKMLYIYLWNIDVNFCPVIDIYVEAICNQTLRKHIASLLNIKQYRDEVTLDKRAVFSHESVIPRASNRTWFW